MEAISLFSDLHLDRSTPRLDYESYRLTGGMDIVATDLSFRYPSAQSDVLRGINLTIPAGSTLAIVGLNGGGKTTLVKVLMGLYAHRGSLTLNGQPMAAYDPTTVHRRTSGLFQDFCKYSFTLRENVGIGHVEKLEEDEALEVAIERGGARGLLEKIGLDGELSRWGVPDAQGESAAGAKSSSGTKVTSKAAGAEGRLARLQVRAAEALGLGGTSRKAKSASDRSSVYHLGPGRAQDADDNRSVPIPSSPSKTLSEQRATLSGGQWQRVALSRAFMRASEADLVIFE